MAYGMKEKKMMPSGMAKKMAPTKKMAGEKMITAKKMAPKASMYKKKM
jgi:hypothetical protein